MSKINIGSNNTFNKSQFGDKNRMNIYGASPNAISYMTDNDWDELKAFINEESGKRGISKNDAQEILTCAENRDTKGLKRILTSDAKNFLLNVLGSSVSTGLFMALEMLCGITP